VEPTAVSLLGLWNDFYVIVGSAAAALTGLQFVVIVLGAQVDVASEGANRAFGSPTIVHFCAVLLVSAMLSAPWPSMPSVALALGPCALVGFVYTMLVVRHARRQTDYTLVLEDWIWHAALPLVAYATFVGGAIALRNDPATSLFVVAAGSLLLLFIGIHNAWDAVTYIALRRRKGPEGAPAKT
jgi:hypothetical protein